MDQIVPLSERAEEALGVALKLFTERGYDNTPMSVVADALGLTKAGVYHHFESKEHLLYLVHKRTLEKQLVPLIVEAEREPSPEKRIGDFLIAYVELLAHDSGTGMLINESRRLAPEHLAEIRDIWRRGFQMLRDSVAAMQGAGLCRAGVDPSIAAFGAIGMASWVIHWFDPARPKMAGAVARQLSGLFLAGILKNNLRS